LRFDAFTVTESDHFGRKLHSNCGGNILGILISIFDELVDEVGFSNVGISCQDNLMMVDLLL
jgi:hypothetical protein